MRHSHIQSTFQRTDAIYLLSSTRRVFWLRMLLQRVASRRAHWALSERVPWTLARGLFLDKRSGVRPWRSLEATRHPSPLRKAALTSGLPDRTRCQ